MNPPPAKLPAPSGAEIRKFPTIATSQFDRIGSVLDARKNRDGIWECANLRTVKPPRMVFRNGMWIPVPDDWNPPGGAAAAAVEYRSAA